MHSAFVMEIIKTWSSSIKAISHDWIQLVLAVLDDGPQLMFKCYFREEAKILEQQVKSKGCQTSQDQILGEGTYADLQVQALYDKQILFLCQKATLSAWDRIQQVGKLIKSYTRVKQGQREPFSAFLQRLTKAIQIGVTDPDAR